jgi:hypothetical protein
VHVYYDDNAKEKVYFEFIRVEDRFDPNLFVRDMRSESWEEQAKGVIRRPDKLLETSDLT